MDHTQLQVERAVGDKFVEWLNRHKGWQLAFSHREKEAPDLVYSADKQTIRVEVVGAYYDSAHAKLLWANARLLPNAPAGWSGVNFDRSLLHDIELQIEKKCEKAYGPKCVLLVWVRPALTPANDIEELLPDLVLPDHVPFAGVFLAGDLPTSPDCQGGYYVWPLKEIEG